MFISDNEGFERIVVNQADMANRAFNGMNEGEVDHCLPFHISMRKKYKLEWKNAGVIGFLYLLHELSAMDIRRSNIIEIHYGPSNFPEEIEYSCGLLEYYAQ